MKGFTSAHIGVIETWILRLTVIVRRKVFRLKIFRDNSWNHIKSQASFALIWRLHAGVVCTYQKSSTGTVVMTHKYYGFLELRRVKKETTGR